MSFRHDKIRGSHPITPKKGIKETDLTIKEKGVNDTIAVSLKPGNKKSKTETTKEFVKPEELIDEIIWHMRNDDDYRDNSDQEIKYMYSRIPSEMRNKIDNFFIYMTGYGLGTIIKTADAKGNTLQSEIIDLHDEDDQDVEKESYGLYHHYKGLDKADKQMINYVLVRTTGFEMETMLNGRTKLSHKDRPEDWQLPPSERRNGGSY